MAQPQEANNNIPAQQISLVLMVGANARACYPQLATGPTAEAERHYNAINDDAYGNIRRIYPRVYKLILCIGSSTLKFNVPNVCKLLTFWREHMRDLQVYWKPALFEHPNYEHIGMVNARMIHDLIETIGSLPHLSTLTLSMYNVNYFPSFIASDMEFLARLDSFCLSTNNMVGGSLRGALDACAQRGRLQYMALGNPINREHLNVILKPEFRDRITVLNIREITDLDLSNICTNFSGSLSAISLITSEWLSFEQVVECLSIVRNLQELKIKLSTLLRDEDGQQINRTLDTVVKVIVNPERFFNGRVLANIFPRATIRASPLEHEMILPVGGGYV